MIAAELRGGSKPSLDEALGWIGSRVDDIYGASIGRLDDVWIDPGTGVPRWLLVVEGRFGGRSTLIPFEDATAGAGHVWVPYERDVVRAAPEVQPGAPLTQELETSLRAHYASSAPRSATRPAPPSGRAPRERQNATTTVRFGGERSEQDSGTEAGASGHAAPAAVPHAEAPVRMPDRPAPPVEAPAAREEAPPQEPTEDELVYRRRASEAGEASPAFASRPDPLRYDAPQSERDPYRYAPEPEARPGAERPDPAQTHVDALRGLAADGGSHIVEIELTGELTIRGELRSIRVTPRDRPAR